MLCLEAHAKINWTLDILGTRPDGYHLMDMLMQSVELCDTLWLDNADRLTLESIDGCFLPDDVQSDSFASRAVTFDETNLVFRAARLLQTHCGCTKGARMILQKRIPSGAGMGGGSADAAAALKGLNDLWQLGLTQRELLELGLKLGADVPFMLTGGLARVSGIGEIIQPLSPAPQVDLLMLQPGSGLSTREVFKAFDALDPEALSRPATYNAQTALLTSDLAALGRSMNNVLEDVSIQARPAIREAAEKLEQLGAFRAMMTGSGSVVYGIFSSRSCAENACREISLWSERKGWGAAWVTRTTQK